MFPHAQIPTTLHECQSQRHTELYNQQGSFDVDLCHAHRRGTVMIFIIITCIECLKRLFKTIL